MKLLTKEHQKSYKNSKIYYNCQEKFENKCLKDKKYCKVRDQCHYTEFVRSREKTYSYLIDDGSEDKKAKGTNKCHKKNLNLKIIETV